MPETITNLATQTEAQISTQEDTVLEKEALSRPKGGVSVVTVSRFIHFLFPFAFTKRFLRFSN